MAAFTQVKFSLPRNLRGRSIHQNVIPTVANLKNMLESLVSVNGDVNKLKQWEKRSYSAYLIEKIKKDVIGAPTKVHRVNLIKNHILDGEPNDFGASCIDIYLVAYVAESIKPGKQAFIEYVMKNGITDKLNSAQAIWQVGKGDGVYLGVLYNDGTIRDWDFFSQWISGSKVKMHNKLIRDRIPAIIENSGKKFKTRQLSNEEYIKELKKKAFEELDEFVEAQSNEEAREELADLLEVIHSLAEYYGSSFSEIEKTRKQKAEMRGGFKDRIFLIEVEK